MHANGNRHRIDEKDEIGLSVVAEFSPFELHAAYRPSIHDGFSAATSGRYREYILAVMVHHRRPHFSTGMLEERI